MHKQKK